MLTREQIENLEIGDYVIYDLKIGNSSRLGKVIHRELKTSWSLPSVKIAWEDARFLGESLFGETYSVDNEIFLWINAVNGTNEIQTRYLDNITKKINSIQMMFDEFKKWALFENI